MTEAQDYDIAMRVAAAEYEKVTSALRSYGYHASVTQTGGMCLAIEITLPNNHHVLVTDHCDPLPWSRDEQEGWAVGIYPDNGGDATSLWLCETDTSIELLLEGLRHVLPSRDQLT